MSLCVLTDGSTVHILLNVDRMSVAKVLQECLTGLKTAVGLRCLRNAQRPLDSDALTQLYAEFQTMIDTAQETLA